MIINQQSDNRQKGNIKNLGAKRARNMDTESNNGTVSDILYPECHLNSPIVKGKIAQLHTIMSLPQPYDMDDDSILVITRQKIKLNKLDKRQRSIRRLKLILIEKVSDLGKYTFIRYPEMSKETE